MREPAKIIFAAAMSAVFTFAALVLAFDYGRQFQHSNATRHCPPRVNFDALKSQRLDPASGDLLCTYHGRTGFLRMSAPAGMGG